MFFQDGASLLGKLEETRRLLALGEKRSAEAAEGKSPLSLNGRFGLKQWHVFVPKLTIFYQWTGVST